MNRSIFAPTMSAPADPILGIKQRFLPDPNPLKVDLSVGVYQDDEGRTNYLPVVCEAQLRLVRDDRQAGYLPIDGLAGYNQHVQKLLFGGNSELIVNKRLVTVQSVGGTSALRYGADFLRRYYPHATVYLSDPTWENHRAIFERAGFKTQLYPYYVPAEHGVAFEMMLDRLGAIPEGSVVLLHASCHNPTGIDMSREQWDDVIKVLQSRSLIPFIDFAYQGLWRGLEEDAFAVRSCAAAGLEFLVASSFSKNFSLYRRRTGALTLVTAGPDEATRVLSQIKTDIRTNNSNPPVDGAAIVNMILSDPELRRQWEGELAGMRERIQRMRCRLVDLLQARGLGDLFAHIAHQAGMFSYSGLSAAQVERLEKEFSIYALASGRICVAALNSKNIEYVADAIAKVIK